MTPAPRNELEAAYFTLLRAREDLAELHRYAEYLERERRRLQRAAAEADALEAHVHPRLRRGIAHTDAPLEAAVRGRLESIEAERDRLPERIAAAEAFVAEAEADHARLRAG